MARPRAAHLLERAVGEAQLICELDRRQKSTSGTLRRTCRRIYAAF
jgi:hypothetical protein